MKFTLHSRLLLSLYLFIFSAVRQRVGRVWGFAMQNEGEGLGTASEWCKVKRNSSGGQGKSQWDEHYVEFFVDCVWVSLCFASFRSLDRSEAFFACPETLRPISKHFFNFSVALRSKLEWFCLPCLPVSLGLNLKHFMLVSWLWGPIWSDFYLSGDFEAHSEAFFSFQA